MCRDLWWLHASHNAEYERKVGIINLKTQSGIQQLRCLCVGASSNKQKKKRGGLRRSFAGMQRMMASMGRGMPTSPL